MANLNVAGGLRGATEVLKGLLVGGAEGLKTEEAQRKEKEKRNALAAYRAAAIRKDYDRMDLEKRRIQVAENHLLLEKQKVEAKQNQERLQAAAIGTQAKNYGVPVIPGLERQALGEVYQRSRPASMAEKPLRLTLAQQVAEARRLRNEEMAPLIQKKAMLAGQLGYSAEKGADIAPSDLADIYHAAMENPSGPTGLSNYMAYTQVQKDLAKIRDNPAGLTPYMEKVRHSYNIPLDEHTSAMEEELLKGQADAASAQTPEATREDVLNMDPTSFPDQETARQFYEDNSHLFSPDELQTINDFIDTSSVYQPK